MKFNHTFFKSTVCNLLIMFYSCGSKQKNNHIKTPLNDSLIVEKTIFIPPDTAVLLDDDWGRIVKYGYHLVKTQPII